LKKGEVQITVVATGFNEEKVMENPIEKLSRLSINESRKKESTPEMKITYPEKFEPKMIIDERIPPKPAKINVTPKEKDLSDDDDELEIPAFIRRKMGK
jgi:hypothetical protein